MFSVTSYLICVLDGKAVINSKRVSPRPRKMADRCQRSTKASGAASERSREGAGSMLGMQCHKSLEHAFPIDEAVQQHGQDR